MCWGDDKVLAATFITQNKVSIIGVWCIDESTHVTDRQTEPVSPEFDTKVWSWDCPLQGQLAINKPTSKPHPGRRGDMSHWYSIAELWIKRINNWITLVYTQLTCMTFLKIYFLGQYHLHNKNNRAWPFNNISRLKCLWTQIMQQLNQQRNECCTQ